MNQRHIGYHEFLALLKQNHAHLQTTKFFIAPLCFPYFVHHLLYKSLFLLLDNYQHLHKSLWIISYQYFGLISLNENFAHILPFLIIINYYKICFHWNFLFFLKNTFQWNWCFLELKLVILCFYFSIQQKKLEFNLEISWHMYCLWKDEEHL